MISEKTLRKCAENIVKCVNIKEDESVYIRGNLCYQKIIEEVALEVLRCGGHPLMNLRSDNYFETLVNDDTIKNETIEKTPKHILKLTENIDVRITFDFYEDPSKRTQFPKDRVKSLLMAYKPLNSIVLGNEEKYAPGKKWLYVGWPTKKSGGIL